MRFKSCKEAALYLRDQSSMDVAVPSAEGEMRQINDSSHMLLESVSTIYGH